MCGIVGFIGREQAAPILLDGLARLEVSDINQETISQNILEKKKKENRQTDLFHLPQDDLIDELKNLDVLSITPMDALNTLFRLREKARRL